MRKQASISVASFKHDKRAYQHNNYRSDMSIYTFTYR